MMTIDEKADYANGWANTVFDEDGDPVLRTVRDMHGVSVYVPVGGDGSGWQLACCVEAVRVGRDKRPDGLAMSLTPVLLPEGWTTAREKVAPHEEAIQYGVV